MAEKPLRAATVSRVLAKAGLPRVTRTSAGFVQSSGFEVNQHGNATAGEVRVNWRTLVGVRGELTDGLERCAAALNEAGYRVQSQDGRWLLVTTGEGED